MSFGFYNTRSTYQSDFVGFQPTKTEAKIRYEDPVEKMKPTRIIQKNISTMTNFQPDVYVPFDLFFRPKECITTNPFEDVKYSRKDKSNEFAERLEARQTRPRVFMIPQISLDDVDQILMYKKNGLIDNIYTSDWKLATEFTKDFSSKTIGETPINYKPKIVGFKAKDFCVPIEPGLQKYSARWDGYQLRSYYDVSKHFWKKHENLGTCSICSPKAEETLSQDESAEIKECLANDSLRLPYQLKTPGYSGYIPKIPINIKARRKLFSRVDPWLSSTMVSQGVYK